MLISSFLSRIATGLLILTTIIVIDTSGFSVAGLVTNEKFGFGSKVINGYIVSNSSTWFDCTANTGYQWVCDTTDPIVYAAEIDQLSVMGASSAWN